MLIKKEEEDGRILGDESWVEEPWKKFRDESVVYSRLWTLTYSFQKFFILSIHLALTEPEVA
jgi:hypothetical protein